MYLQDTTQCSKAEEAAAAAAAATKIDTLGITVSICCCRHCPALMFCNLLGTLWHALRLEGQRQVHVCLPPFHPPTWIHLPASRILRQISVFGIVGRSFAADSLINIDSTVDLLSALLDTLAEVSEKKKKKKILVLKFSLSYTMIYYR